MSSSAPRPKSPFLIGVIGGGDLNSDEQDQLAERMKTLLWFLKYGGEPRQIEAFPPKFETQDEANRRVNAFVHLFSQGRDDHRLGRVLKQVFRHWHGLRNTPIVVLTGLAPGAASLLADVALGDEFKGCEISVRGVLPLDKDLYVQTSTFVRAKQDANGMRVPSQEDVARQETFTRLCNKIQAADSESANPWSPVTDDVRIYTVRLRRDRDPVLKMEVDRDPTPFEIRQRMESERDDTDAVHEREYAAGEHLSIVSHLLITIRNTGDAASTKSISKIEDSRLSGRRPDILPAAQSLQMPHGGPLLVLWDRPEKQICSTLVNGPKAKLRFPFLPHPPVVPRSDGTAAKHLKHEESERAYKHWLLEQAAQFRRTADNLERFNSKTLSHHHAFEKNFQELTTYHEPDASPDADEVERDQEPKRVSLFEASAGLEATEARFRDKLRRVAALFHSADVQSQLARKDGSAIFHMFQLTLLAAVLWHVFCHWHLESTKPPCPDPPSAEAPAAPAPKEHLNTDDTEDAKHLRSLFRSAAGGFALLISAGTLLYFVGKNSQQHDEQDHDYRAIAEGLRVQFFWNLAGLGESVSANYMHRQRSELDWIRAAVRATSLPYEQWSDAFRDLSDGFKLRSLEAVQCSWVIDQRNYFKRAFNKHRLSLHAWHFLGRTLALTGVLCGAYWWAADAFWTKPHVTPEWLRRLPDWWPLYLLSTIGLYFFNLRNGLHHEHLPKKSETWWKILMHTLIGGHDSSAAAYMTQRRLVKQSLIDFCRYLLPTMFLSSVVLLLCECCGRCWDCIPSCHNLGIITSGALLLLGALSVAWAEKRLYSELAYQYQTMYALFRHAAAHINRELEELEQGLDAQTDSARDPAAFNKQINDLQHFLFALGKEALDENAEWLLLHRARPLEPVMAG